MVPTIDSTPGVIPQWVNLGADLIYTFTLDDGAGDPLDLTGATITWDLTHPTGRILLEGDVVIDADPTTGVATLTVPTTTLKRNAQYLLSIRGVISGFNFVLAQFEVGVLP